MKEALSQESLQGNVLLNTCFSKMMKPHVSWKHYFSFYIMSFHCFQLIMYPYNNIMFIFLSCDSFI